VADDEVIYGDGLQSTNAASAIKNSELRLPAGRAKALRIRYTANSLADPRHVLFRCKLSGCDDDWRDMADEREAYYTSLKPGHYSFEVQAVNAHGVWNETPVTFVFSVAPHLYETWTFYGFCAAAILAAGIGLHYRRVNIVQRIERLEREQALQLERARIARDLHDDLGASLTGLALKADLAQRQSRGGDNSNRQLGEIAASTRALVDNMRETVWALNPKHDTLEGLARFLAQRVEDFVTDSGLRCTLELPDQFPSLVVPSPARHQISLVVKEALNNAVKHADAREIQFRLDTNGADLCLRIADDGRGFSGDEALADPDNQIPGTGNGLLNMRQRIESLGGNWNLETADGRGTTISIRFPLKSFRPTTP
jgi:signal transduction histidine kinase